MKLAHPARRLAAALAVMIAIAGIGSVGSRFPYGVTAIAAEGAPKRQGAFFLPTGDAAKIVTVTRSGEAQAAVTVLTQADGYAAFGSGKVITTRGLAQ